MCARYILALYKKGVWQMKKEDYAVVKENIKSQYAQNIGTDGKPKHFPTKIVEANQEFVFDFMDKLDADEQQWCMNTVEKLSKSKGEGKSFIPFRTEFCKRYFPEFIGKKPNVKKVSFADKMMKRYKTPQSKTRE